MTTQGPKWTQDQAIAYEAALEAINDVIAGYSEQLSIAEQQLNLKRAEWLRMRVWQARDVADSLNVEDDVTVKQALQEYSAIVRARDAADQVPVAA